MAGPDELDRSILGVVGTLVGTLAAALLVAGLGGVAVHLYQEPDGVVTGDDHRLASDGAAVTTDELSLGASVGTWIPEGSALIHTITVTPRTDDPVFVGIAPSTEVERALEGVAHTRLLSMDDDDRVWTEQEGAATAPAPTDVDIWVASGIGVGTQTLRWHGEPGTWDLVVMHPTGQAGIDVDARASLLLADALPLGRLLLGVGLALGVVATSLWLLGSTSDSRRGLLHVAGGVNPDA